MSAPHGQGPPRSTVADVMGAVIAHYTAIGDPTGGSPTLDVTIESAALVGFGSPTTRMTFSQMTARGAQFASVAGAITDPYWRVKWTLGGSTPGFALVVAIGIQ